MNKKRFAFIAVLLLSLYILAACQPQEAVREVEVTRVVTETITEGGEEVEVTRVVTEEIIEVVTATPGVRSGPADDTVAASQPAERLIIKNGTMEITVMDTDEAAQSAALRAQEFGGYVLSQQIWDGDRGYRYAATQAGYQCFCGNSYGKYGKAGNCNYSCSGDPAKTCGGSWANSVFDLR